MDMDEAEEAYLHNSIFHETVDGLFHHLMVGDISVYELRDACTLAINKFVQRRLPESIKVPKDVKFIDNEKEV